MTGDLPATITAGSYDLVMAFEMIHDLARPVEALTTMRRLGKPDAVHLVMDEKVAETFEAPTENPVERLMYAASVLHCLPVGRADTPSAATGTVMRPATFAGYADRAGFATVERPADRTRPLPLLPPHPLTTYRHAARATSHRRRCQVAARHPRAIASGDCVDNPAMETLWHARAEIAWAHVYVWSPDLSKRRRCTNHVPSQR